MLLILSSANDLTADFLIVELRRRNLPYFRLNSEDVAQAQCTFSLDDRGLARHISIGPRSLDLSSVHAVWYRRAISPVPAGALSSGERAYVAGELRHLVTGLVLHPDILWVNPIDRVSMAEHKLYQLRLARSIGFTVPRTIVSRNADELRAFAAANNKGTICKPIFHGLLVDASSRYSIYTRRVVPDEINADDVDSCPVLLQEEVEREADVRATFIGPDVFVADIKGEKPLIDWRDPQSSVRYFPSALAPSVTEMCRTMLSRLGLVYGAFDFIRTPQGGLFFLEVNPTGEWAWLENTLGFPMRDAFVRLFFGGTNESTVHH